MIVNCCACIYLLMAAIIHGAEDSVPRIQSDDKLEVTITTLAGTPEIKSMSRHETIADLRRKMPYDKERYTRFLYGAHECADDEIMGSFASEGKVQLSALEQHSAWKLSIDEALRLVNEIKTSPKERFYNWGWSQESGLRDETSCNYVQQLIDAVLNRKLYIGQVHVDDLGDDMFRGTQFGSSFILRINNFCLKPGSSISFEALKDRSDIANVFLTGSDGDISDETMLSIMKNIPRSVTQIYFTSVLNGDLLLKFVDGLSNGIALRGLNLSNNHLVGVDWKPIADALDALHDFEDVLIFEKREFFVGWDWAAEIRGKFAGKTKVTIRVLD